MEGVGASGVRLEPMAMTEFLRRGVGDLDAII